MSENAEAVKAPPDYRPLQIGDDEFPESNEPKIGGSDPPSVDKNTTSESPSLRTGKRKSNELFLSSSGDFSYLAKINI